ncbi:MAG: hypothetical protein ACFFD2_16225 [Promethearchaeota archaeon]
MSSNEILALIEKFETSFDSFQQNLQKSIDDIIQQLSEVWKKMQLIQKEEEKISQILHQQNSEITELNTKSEDLDNRIADLKTKKEEITSKITELKKDYEKIIDDSKQPKLELDNTISQLEKLNEKISKKESELNQLETKKITNENKEDELKNEFANKTEELEEKLVKLRNENFFLSFLIENSDEDIPEVEIIAKIMEQGNCKLDELKKSLEIPPIMAVRTIKKMGVKGLININEDTNDISISNT